MNFKIIVLAGLLLAGCSSTESISSNTENDVLNNEPSVQLTVVAQSLSQWPYAKQQLTYSIKNKDITPNTGEKISSWKSITETNIIAKLNSLGLTQASDEKANLSIIYGVTAPSDNTKAADAMFDTLGLTTGSSTGGTNGAIDITINDNRSGIAIWAGAVSAAVDKPIKTETTKNRVIKSLIDSLLNKLPQAN
jgi:hypothetical protein